MGQEGRATAALPAIYVCSQAGAGCKELVREQWFGEREADGHCSFN